MPNRTARSSELQPSTGRTGDTAWTGIAQFDAEHKLAHVSSACLRHLPSIASVLAPGRDLKQILSLCREIAEAEEDVPESENSGDLPEPTSFLVVDPDSGRRIRVDCHLLPQGGALLTTTDRTGFEPADEILEAQTRWLERTESAVGVGHWVWSAKTRDFRCSLEAYRILGLAPGIIDLTDEAAVAIYHPDDRHLVRACLRRAFEKHQDYRFEARLQRPGGSLRYVIASGLCDFDGDGNLRAIFGTFQDITRQKRVEAALRESERRYRNLFDESPISIWEVSFSDVKRHLDQLVNDGIDDPVDYLKQEPDAMQAIVEMIKISDFNQATIDLYRAPDRLALMTGMKEFLELNYWDSFADTIGAFLRGEHRHVSECRERAFDGSELVVRIVRQLPEEFKGDWSRVIETVEDITEQKQAEAELRQANKMEAVGQLTGGLAHDFNNLLAVVLGNLELIGERIPDDEALRTLVEKALAAGERGATLTHRLLAFSRRQALSPQPLDANELLAGMVDMLDRTLGEAVEISLLSHEGLWNCIADPVQLETAILNLAINARDAMPHGGQLTIATDNAHIEASLPHRPEAVAAGDYVVLSVSDSGIGMPPDIQERVFEPFFTTKEVGKGSGLGLSMIYGFVRQSGGSVVLDSTPGKGTVVRIYLPRVSDDTDRISEPEEVASTYGGRGESVLLVEDDRKVRELVADQLVSLGYRVKTAADSHEAFGLVDATSAFDLLLTDVVLPGGMTGPEFAKLTQSRFPDLKVLLMSGYSTADSVQLDDVAVFGPPLKKPFRKQDLARAVREALGEEVGEEAADRTAAEDAAGANGVAQGIEATEKPGDNRPLEEAAYLS